MTVRTFFFNFTYSDIKGLMLFLLFLAPTGIFAQGTCLEIDPSFTVSNMSPEVGEEVVFIYNGSLDLCADCSYYLSYYDLDFGGGSPHAGGEPGPPVIIDEVIGRHIYKEVGSVTVTLTIHSDILDCTESYSLGLTVTNPQEPLAMFTVGSVGLCVTDQRYSFVIDTVGTAGYTITNVAWHMGDSPDIINTADLDLTHVYLGSGETYYVVAVVSFSNGLVTLDKTVVNIVNRGTVDDFTGLDSYLRVSVMNGDPSFNPVLSFPGGVPHVDFIYQGYPYPTAVEDVELGWGPVSWGTIFKMNGSPITVLPYNQEFGEQIVATQTDLTLGWNSAELQIFWTMPDNPLVELTQCSNWNTVMFYVPDAVCDSCNSFKPKANERYWMSAWVKVGEEQVKSYNPDGNTTGDIIDPLEIEDAYIEFFFTGPNTSVYFFPTGEIIDGWQRVVGEFTIPDGTFDFELNLFADLTSDTYFDDIRIHPFNGSMKSYVYDGETFWLTSELDDNNYATFYEYDQEGGLIRIKKETSRGIVTIQETKSSTIKQ